MHITYTILYTIHTNSILYTKLYYTLYRATYPLLKTISTSLKSVPLIGSLPEYALSVLSYLNRMHFYHSNS